MLQWKTNKYYVLWVCVCSHSYPACRAPVPYYTNICGLSGCTIFFHIISLTARISGGKMSLDIKRVFWFFWTTFVSNIPQAKKNWARYDQKCRRLDVLMSSARYSCQIKKKKTWIFSTIFEEYSNIKFHENPSCGSPLVQWGRTHMTKLTVAFRNFANSPNRIKVFPLRRKAYKGK